MIRTGSAAIASAEDIAAHLAALIVIEPRFAEIAETAGEIPLRPLAPDYSGLAWIIVGQQISVAAGRAIYARLEASLGTIEANTILAADDDALRGAGLSIQKIRALRAVAEAVAAGDLRFEALPALEAEAAIAQLCGIRGIGRWTAEVYLLFALGHPDIFPAGDLAVRAAAGIAFHDGERPSENDLRAASQPWRPHRSVAARLFFAYYRAVKNGRDTTPV